MDEQSAESDSQDSTEEDVLGLNEAAKSRIELNRRNVIKLASFIGSMGLSTSSFVMVSGVPVEAQVSGEQNLDQANEAINFTEKTATDIQIRGSTTFQVGWENMVRGDIIELRLRLQPIDVSSPAGTARSGFDGFTDNGNYEVIGQMGLQVNTPARTEDADTPDLKSVDGSSFFENRDHVNVTAHPDIFESHIGVDFDDPNDVFTESLISDWDTFGANPTLPDIGIDPSHIDSNRLAFDGDDKLILNRSDNPDVVLIDPSATTTSRYMRIIVFELVLDSKGPNEDSFSKIDSWSLLIVTNINGGFGRFFGHMFGVGGAPI